MHIYKTFFKVAKQHRVSIIMYFCIILFMLIAMTSGQTSNNSMGAVTLKKYPLLVVDEDHSPISEVLVGYLGEKHDLKEGDYTEDQIKLMLYYWRISDYIVIPKGFGDAFLEVVKSDPSDIKNEDIMTLLEAQYDEAMPRGIFVNIQMNEYLNAIADYMKQGNSLEEASEKALESLDITRFASMQAEEENYFDSIYTSFVFLPFGIISIIFSGVLAVIVSFNEKEKKDRTAVSSIKMTGRNVSLVMGTLTIAVIVSTLLIIITSLLHGQNVIFTERWWLAVLNTFVYTITITLLLSMITSLPLGIDKSGTANSSSFITVIISLSFAFLGGTFVDLQILGDKVTSISRFIPNYWYSLACRKIWYEDASINDLWVSFGFQLLFGIVCLSIGLVFTRFFDNKANS